MNNEYNLNTLTGTEILQLMDSGKFIPWSVVTISTDGKILD